MSDSGPSDSEAGVVRIATRASRLALWQARHVARLLSRSDPGVVVELVEVSTEGDRDRVARLDAMGGTGVFTREVQQVVLDGRADLAVHSLKDLPTDSVAGLLLAGVPERGDTGDALVVSQPVEATEPHRSHLTGLEALSLGARVGTGSPRRAAQIKHLREDLLLEGIRGNVETRLRKLDEGEYDAVVLAVAGLVRLELSERITAVLDPKRILGAVGGAALGLECREDDRSTAGRLEAISHRETWLAVTAERAMLSRLRAGCHAPVGAQTGLAGGRLWLSGVVLDALGTRRVEARLETDVALGDGSAAFGEIQGAAGRLGEAVADELLAAGAAELISG